ncbi:uncharacterized protein LACBIDRAFT_301702 [Laccaria bicolor S238N-H82]|uniref:Predicted protein n=1 Tax=Laccaria bicolor (strain S238N-H82 / ATCC MYA-4686) TaxID=486041 RepID=B0CP30_LACBS|nr:uncharacterized protein LACBIDRAFT_301702 [Laccaria bicolor S238N-H82]EDR15403.1 predicted protein [Laccaria bicolor S238N-H82]|eukprot:XP_001873611.1 predicted protein [Laccaria bicolor S238N-H82]
MSFSSLSLRWRTSKWKNQDRYPTLTPFDHVDPGLHSLSHPNPRSFLNGATSITEITPHLGTEVVVINITEANADGWDQLAFEICTSLAENCSFSGIGKASLTETHSFVESAGAWTLEGERVEPSRQPLAYAYLQAPHPSYICPSLKLPRDPFGIHWHSDVSHELPWPPPGLTTVFLLSQPQTGGDTLFTSQVFPLKELSPQFMAFLRTLKAVHSGVEQANFSHPGHRGVGV